MYELGWAASLTMSAFSCAHTPAPFVRKPEISLWGITLALAVTGREQPGNLQLAPGSVVSRPC